MSNKGVSLIQYAIVLALISIGVIGIYSMFGQEIVKLLSNYLNMYSSNNAKVAENTQTKPPNITPALDEPGDFGGTVQTPVYKCTNGICDIDFGNYILTGVPEDLDQIVQSAGSSGANDKMYDLFTQLADQVNSEGNSTDAQSLEDLANLAKFMGTLQQSEEVAASTCLNSSDKRTCMKNAIVNAYNVNVAIPSELSKFFNNLDTNDTYNYATQIHSNNIGHARFDKLNTQTYNSNTGKYPSYAFVDTFDKVMSSSKLPDNLKGIAKELYLSVNDINLEFQLRETGAKSSTQSALNYEIPIYNALSGSLNELKDPSPIDFLPIGKLSRSNTVSSLACFSSNYNDNCHQTME